MKRQRRHSNPKWGESGLYCIMLAYFGAIKHPAENVHSHFLGLGTRTDYREVVSKGLMKETSPEFRGSPRWFRLTVIGKKVVEALINHKAFAADGDLKISNQLIKETYTKVIWNRREFFRNRRYHT